MLYTLPQVVEMLNVPYHRVYYATLTGRVQPKRFGRTRLLTAFQVEELRDYFFERNRNEDAIRKTRGKSD